MGNAELFFDEKMYRYIAMSGIFSQIAELGRADAQWDLLFCNRVLGIECKPGDENLRPVHIPNIGAVNDARVKCAMPALQMSIPDLIELDTLETHIGYVKNARIERGPRVECILQQ